MSYRPLGRRGLWPGDSPPPGSRYPGGRCVAAGSGAPTNEALNLLARELNAELASITAPRAADLITERR